MNKTKPIWIILVGKTRAKVFEFVSKLDTAKELFEIDNPLGRLKEQDLVSDRPGRAMHFRHTQRNPLPRHRKKTQKVLADFTDVLANQLSSLKRKGRFAKLMLIAEPNILGKLRTSIADYKNLEIISEVRRNLIKTPTKKLEQELTKYINAEL